MYFCEFYVCTSNVIFIMFGTCYLLLLLLVLHKVVHLCVYVYFCIYQSDDIIYLFYRFLLFVALHACISKIFNFLLMAHLLSSLDYINAHLFTTISLWSRVCLLLVVAGYGGVGGGCVGACVRECVCECARALMYSTKILKKFLLVDFHCFSLGFFCFFCLTSIYHKFIFHFSFHFMFFFQIFIFLQFNF